MRNVLYGLILFSLGLLVGGIVVAWKIPHGKAVSGTVAPELAGVTPTVQTLPVKTYPVTVNKKLSVPVGVKVLTSTQVDHKTITAAIDSEGDISLFIRKDPLPWLWKARTQEISLISGYMAGEWVNRLGYRYSLYHVKQLDIGLAGESNIGSHLGHKAVVGVSLSYSW